MNRFRSELDEELLSRVAALACEKRGEMSDEDKRSLRRLAYDIDIIPYDLSGPCDFAPGLLGYLDDHFYPELGCLHGEVHKDPRPGCVRLPALWSGVRKMVEDSQEHYRIDREWYDRRVTWLRDGESKK